MLPAYATTEHSWHAPDARARSGTRAAPRRAVTTTVRLSCASFSARERTASCAPQTRRRHHTASPLSTSRHCFVRGRFRRHGHRCRGGRIPRVACAAFAIRHQSFGGAPPLLFHTLFYRPLFSSMAVLLDTCVRAPTVSQASSPRITHLSRPFLRFVARQHLPAVRRIRDFLSTVRAAVHRVFPCVRLKTTHVYLHPRTFAHRHNPHRVRACPTRKAHSCCLASPTDASTTRKTTSHTSEMTTHKTAHRFHPRHLRRRRRRRRHPPRSALQSRRQRRRHAHVLIL